MKKIKVMTVFGTRPEAIKMAPVVLRLQVDSRFEALTVVTAQHREMLDQVLEIFKITPDYDFNIMHKNQTENRMQSMENRMQNVENRMQNVENEVCQIKNEVCQVKNEVHQIKLCQENVILPRLNTIESCYTDTYKRYKDNADKMDAAFEDIALLKETVAEHSEKIQKLQKMA